MAIGKSGRGIEKESERERERERRRKRGIEGMIMRAREGGKGGVRPQDRARVVVTLAWSLACLGARCSTANGMRGKCEIAMGRHDAKTKLGC